MTLGLGPWQSFIEMYCRKEKCFCYGLSKQIKMYECAHLCEN